MAVVKVFKERDKGKYGKHTFKNEIEHLEYLMTQYVIKDEKTLSKEWLGINCNDNPEIAYEEFISTKDKFGKYDPNNIKSREFKHYTISFTHEESKMLGAKSINAMVKEICERVPEFKNYQISIATHEDKKHIHSHIIVNSVNMLDGHKIQLPNSFLTKFQLICNEYTKEQGLSEHKLPYSLKIGDNNVSFNYVDYNAHQNNKKSKTEQFADRIKMVIAKTKNKLDLYKAMKNNNLKMIWKDDNNYKDKLYLGKITIIDNKTNEKHRLETLIRKYNIDVSNNIDLLNHFLEIDKNNELRNKLIRNNLKIEKDDIDIKNNEGLITLYNEIKNKIKQQKTAKQYYELNKEIKEKITRLSKQLYYNSDALQNKINIKVQELIIKAKEFDKNLDYDSSKKTVEYNLFKIINNKIFNEIKHSKEERITKMTIRFLIKNILNSISCVNNDNIKNASLLDMNRKLKEKEDLNKSIKQAITY